MLVKSIKKEKQETPSRPSSSMQ